jgi:Xaa-Pro dipeptidase
MPATRLEKLYAAMEQNGLDGLALNPGPSLTYLTGLNFHLMERPVVMIFSLHHDPSIVLPQLETAKLAQLAFKVSAFPYAENPAEWNQSFRDALHTADLYGRTIGVEPRRMRVLELRYLEGGAPGAHIVPAENALASLRMRKDEKEIKAMKKAVKVAQDAVVVTVKKIKAGMTEREIASELTVQLLRLGSEPEMPFSPIVASGPNSANPHAAPTNRKLRKGDLLIIDWGATVDGYISDLTRTYAVGKVDPELEKIAAIVKRSNAAGRAAAKPGAPCADVDIAARTVIERAGYGEFFTHRTGHGIGMEGHEDPYMRSDNLQIMTPGMAFTVEPGIYLPNRGGVRIEDNLVITADGAKCLSNLPRELIRIG